MNYPQSTPPKDSRGVFAFVEEALPMVYENPENEYEDRDAHRGNDGDYPENVSG